MIILMNCDKFLCIVDVIIFEKVLTKIIHWIKTVSILSSKGYK